MLTFPKYTATELKKASTAKGKIKFTMKPVVKLAKGNMKGGLFGIIAVNTKEIQVLKNIFVK